MDADRRLHVLVKGRVQGVCFRVCLMEEARSRGVRGWVRNLRDGRVEAMLEGQKTGVDAVLAWCHRLPELAHWTDNIRILETLGREGLFAQEKCDSLTEAYIAYRSAAHQLSLQHQAGIVPAAQFVDLRAAVTAAWQTLFAPI